MSHAIWKYLVHLEDRFVYMASERIISASYNLG